jgi:hypothetical protein
VTCDSNNSDILPHLGGIGGGWVLVAWIWGESSLPFLKFTWEALIWFLPMDLVKMVCHWFAKGGIRITWHQGVVIVSALTFVS